jgi:hypothetical protein
MPFAPLTHTTMGTRLIFVILAALLAVAAPVQASSRLEESHPAVQAAGRWIAHTAPSHSAGAARLSMDTGDRLTITFEAPSIRWIGVRDPWCGIARILLDGKLHTIVDGYAEETAYQATLLDVVGLAPGTHTLTIEVTGTRNARSAGTWVWADAFQLGSAPPAARATGGSPASSHRIEQDAASVLYSGYWYTNQSGQHSGATAALAGEPGSRVNLAFVGQGVRWIGYKDQWGGCARVFIDGTLRATVDTSAEPAVRQATTYQLSGLPEGRHLLSIEVAGRCEGRDGSGWVWIDAFEVLRGPRSAGQR